MGWLEDLWGGVTDAAGSLGDAAYAAGDFISGAGGAVTDAADTLHLAASYDPLSRMLQQIPGSPEHLQTMADTDALNRYSGAVSGAAGAGSMNPAAVGQEAFNGQPYGDILRLLAYADAVKTGIAQGLPPDEAVRRAADTAGGLVPKPPGGYTPPPPGTAPGFTPAQDRGFQPSQGWQQAMSMLPRYGGMQQNPNAAMTKWGLFAGGAPPGATPPGTPGRLPIPSWPPAGGGNQLPTPLPPPTYTAKPPMQLGGAGTAPAPAPAPTMTGTGLSGAGKDAYTGGAIGDAGVGKGLTPYQPALGTVSAGGLVPKVVNQPAPSTVTGTVTGGPTANQPAPSTMTGTVTGGPTANQPLATSITGTATGGPTVYSQPTSLRGMF